jgi:hypothetical protein
MENAIIQLKGREITLGEYAKELIADALVLLQDKRNEYVATQALWDGDTRGWFLDLSLVCKLSSISTVVQVIFVPTGKSLDDFQKEYGASCLASMRFDSDIRLFNGTVPPYPEAWVAQQVGKALEEKLGIPFYFPSPNEANDDCPCWWEQDKGINCADCGKLVIPSDSPYMMKDVCYHCQLNREANEKIIKNTSQKNEIVLYQADEKKENIQLLAFFQKDEKSFNWILIDQLFQKNTPEHIKQGVVWIDSSELESLLPQYDVWFDEKLQAYFRNPTESNARVEKFKRSIKKGFFLGKVQTYEVEYLGKYYTLELCTDDTLVDYINWKESLLHFVKNKQYLVISFRDELGYRDTTFTHFLRNNTNGATFQHYLDKFQKILPETAIKQTLEKLVQGKYIEKTNDVYKLTTKGFCI